MDDFFSLFKALRKIEALFLPLFPLKWRESPPSFRIAAFAINKLQYREKESSWKAALIYSIRNGFYRAYHEMGLASGGQVSDSEMRMIRAILTLVAVVVAIFFSPLSITTSPHVKGALLIGSSTLLVFGSMRLSISALWASWGLLFPLLGSIVMGISPWIMFFLACWVLIWHFSALKEREAWFWYDWLATLPVLFFWMRAIKWVPAWTSFQNGYLSLFIWCCFWLCLTYAKKPRRMTLALQLFFPSSVVCLILLIACSGLPFAESLFYKSWRWALWLTSSLILSFITSELSRWVNKFKLLYRFPTFAVVFISFALSVFFVGNRRELTEAVEISQNYLHSATWPLWWFIGAGIIMLIRRTAMILFNWVQAVLPLWLMPAALLIFSVVVWRFKWFDSLVIGITEKGFWVLVLFLFSGAVVLAINKNRTILKEWIFWGLYVLFLLNRYWLEEYRLVSESSVTLGGLNFFLLAVWLMWLGYYVVGESLSGLRKEGEDGIRAIAFMGAFLLLLSSSLWSIYVDKNFFIQKEISLELFMGFNFFGVSFIIYNMIIQKYLNLESVDKLPWHWIILLGVGLVQILQGMEHYTAAFIVDLPLNDLHLKLHEVYVNSTKPLEEAAPAWVFFPAWAMIWRLIRWFVVMVMLTLLIIRSKEKRMPGTLIMTLTCLTSLAVGVSESYWFQWPSMAPFWSVVFRPWRIDEAVLGWNFSFLKSFVPYALIGVGYGWLLKVYKTGRAKLNN